MKDHDLRELVNALTTSAREFAGTQQLRERIAGIVRPAVAAAIAEERKAQLGPGTPYARFDYLMGELEKRFPYPAQFDSTKTPEQYVLEAVDSLLLANSGGAR